MVIITRRVTFCASHKLYNPLWTNEENLAIFGGCANPKGHGHNYVLWVSVKGKVHPTTGFVINLKDLRQLLEEKIIAKVDHKNLNEDVDFLQNINPTTENLCLTFWRMITQEITHLGAQLYCVKLQETENNTVEYYGEE